MENVMTQQPEVQAQHEHLVQLSMEDQQALGEATLQLAMEQAAAIAAATPHRVTSGNAVGMARVEGTDANGNSLQMTTFDFTKEDYARARQVENQQVLQNHRQNEELFNFMKSHEDDKETVDA